MQQEMEKIQSVKRVRERERERGRKGGRENIVNNSFFLLPSLKDVELLLDTKLADDIGESISDGVVLCHLVNKLYPNTISTIHEPKGPEVSDM